MCVPSVQNAAMPGLTARPPQHSLLNVPRLLLISPSPDISYRSLVSLIGLQKQRNASFELSPRSEPGQHYQTRHLTDIGE